ncbi:zinc ribbon domain-containing protein [Oceanobacillus sp. Castelsardo]|uniref:zinc ribbon domain-containing protein n=1 Tax=Oceanobacillus sp. Castelsardo TaxID=1851204 RepID=UPI0008382B1A|nr:zinc ribbon domain-containing protein [Oceanobacillus sp. Castelsardo]
MAMEEVFSLTNILLMVSILINIVTMIFVIRKRGSAAGVRDSQQLGGDAPVGEPASSDGRAFEAGVVFCRNCGNQYESTEKVCPGCRTPR